MNSKDILLISLPWAGIHLPSIQLGTLKSFLEFHGFKVDIANLYVEFAEIVGLEKYAFLASKGIAAEAPFSAIIYPQMIIPSRALLDECSNKKCDFQDIFDHASQYINQLMATIPFNNYKFVGFSVIFNQLYSSLVLAREIKKFYSQIKIIFGGDLCCGEKGVSLMKVYKEIDYIISYEGERALLELLRGTSDKEIGSLSYRDCGAVCINPPGKVESLDELPSPNFVDYFDRIQKAPKLKNSKKLKSVMMIPVENNRSCWWNKCTFCSLNAQYQVYREKKNDRIYNEIKNQIEKYELRKIFLIGNISNQNNYDALFKLLTGLDIEIRMEYYARNIRYDSIKTMKDAGVSRVQIGLESLSRSMLAKKIKKGVRLIDQIKFLKYIQELNIRSDACIIINYPNETDFELKETIDTFKALYHLEPPNINQFVLSWGSPIYNNFAAYNIQKIYPRRKYKSIIPENVLEKLVLSFYDYHLKEEKINTQKIIIQNMHSWMKSYLKPSKNPKLYYSYKKSGYISVVDGRYKNKDTYNLGKWESEIYLYCNDYRNLLQIQCEFSHLSLDYINKILKYFIDHKLMIKDGNIVLSLAINLENYRNALSQDGFRRHKFYNHRSYLKYRSF